MATKVSASNAQHVPNDTNLASPRPTPQEIAVRAHQIFEQRGGAEGFDFDDWLQAERELMLAANANAASEKPVTSAAVSSTQRSQK
jgi:Protein of unknown function (DUF2934)